MGGAEMLCRRVILKGFFVSWKSRIGLTFTHPLRSLIYDFDPGFRKSFHFITSFPRSIVPRLLTTSISSLPSLIVPRLLTTSITPLSLHRCNITQDNQLLDSYTTPPELSTFTPLHDSYTAAIFYPARPERITSTTLIGKSSPTMAEEVHKQLYGPGPEIQRTSTPSVYGPYHVSVSFSS
jgi:hypothetical protein